MQGVPHAARLNLKVRIFFQPNVVFLILVSRFKIVIRFRARAVYLFSYGISRAEFSLGNRYLKLLAIVLCYTY